MNLNPLREEGLLRGGQEGRKQLENPGPDWVRLVDPVLGYKVRHVDLVWL